MSATVFEQFLSTPEMLGVFSEAGVVQAMLDFEAALARAQAGEGLLTDAQAATIAGACRVEQLDVPALLAASGRAGSLAIPLVQQLKACVAQADPEAARRAHHGSTSQDVIDTAMVLCTRRALALIDRDLSSLAGALLRLADAHITTPMLARTLMQPAAVTSFGFKIAQWLQPLLRAQARLHEAGQRALQLQLGGGVGTLAAMGQAGPAVARRTAALLGLPEPHGAWHTQRDDWVRLACELGVLCGSLGKLARDWSLMGQAEVAELAEPSEAGRGGSTAMPHKRNPVAAMAGLAAAQRAPQRVAALLQAMPQEHERGLGNWQAELAEWTGLLLSAHGALKALADAAAGLQVDTARMRHNLALLGDALAPGTDLDEAAAGAGQRADELLQRLRPQAAALAARQPWRAWLP
ncbi:lyase family protein [Ideonella sp. BN130291]|uniref:lyase family protein n=1 Tax=Ideonella sp. BN130291 TaxID=3112940 RepID=UPI002E26A936|nr:lyase family protein [Ideonella sp. BN130291]